MLLRWWTSRLRAVGRGRFYVRLYPNPGFQLGRFHWCRACGWGWLGPGEFRKAIRKRGR